MSHPNPTHNPSVVYPEDKEDDKVYREYIDKEEAQERQDFIYENAREPIYVGGMYD